MDREELLKLLRTHRGNATWCDGCLKNVGRLDEHIVDLLMPEGVDYLLQAKELP